MLFNSIIFLIFFIAFFFVWFWAKRNDTSRWSCIVLFSAVFYGWWDWRFLFLILFSGLIDFWASLAMERFPTQKKGWLIASLMGNIGGLAVFKYSGFIASLIDSVGFYFGLEWDTHGRLPVFSLVVPVGISFYTFQSMSYTIDVYQNKLKATHSYLHFFAYLMLFPQLVAGPIIRARDLLFQLEKDTKVSTVRIWFGLRLMTYGFFQKMVLADNLAVIVNKAFWNVETQPTFLYWWMVMLAFSFQIYFDFAGYSSIARGLAKLMGYHFRTNFNHPYHAISLRDFWSRWHISLSTWFRDYVYIPLGGSQKSKWAGHKNMWITMLLSGLWHGPALHFVIWGAIHAAFLSLERWSNWMRYLHRSTIGKFLSFLFVLFQVIIAWVFFRAESTEQAMSILSKMFSTNLEGANLLWEQYFDTIIFLILAIAVELWYFAKHHKPRFRQATRHIAYDTISMAILITICIYFRGPASEFIYFQF